MTKQTKIALLVGLVAMTLFGGAFVYQEVAAPEPADAAERKNITVRADSHRLDTAALLARQPAGTHLSVCGPSELNASVLAAAATAGWPSAQVHTEHFGSGASGGTAFEAVLHKSGVRVQVAEDESLLDAIERIGVAAPCLCRGGACGVCITPLLDGEAEHRDHFLSPAEQAQFIMPCVSRARGARLVLDL